ncbi:MAG: MBL fold metallo-hydrolase [Myxococcota bacterium]
MSPRVLLCGLLWAGCASKTHMTQVGDVRVTTLRRDFANTHVVQTPDGDVLVDPGSEEHAAEMDAELKRLGVDPTSFVAIISTHGHSDHAGAASWFHKQYGTPIVAGAGDAPLWSAGRNDRLCPTNRRAARIAREHQDKTYSPFEPQVQIDRPQSASELGLPVGAEQVPGHTPGSLVVHTGNAVFLGDLVRGSIVGRKARTHFFMCDLDDNISDVRALLDRYPGPDTVFFVGHFGPVEAEQVRAWLQGQDER